MHKIINVLLRVERVVDGVYDRDVGQNWMVNLHVKDDVSSVTIEMVVATVLVVFAQKTVKAIVV